MEISADIVDREIVERRSITFLAGESTDLAEQTLNELTNGHTRRNSVGVHNDIRSDTILIEGHILLSTR